MTDSIAILAAKAAHMAGQAESHTGAEEAATTQPAPYPARPTPLTRKYTDNGLPKPVYALPNTPGAFPTTSVPAVVPYTRTPSMDTSRSFLPQGNDTLRSGFHSSQPDYTDKRDEQPVDPLAYGDDNRRQRPKEGSEKSERSERSALERGAHKLKKRVVVEMSRRDLEYVQDEADRYREEAKKWKKLALTFEDENITFREVIEKLKDDVEKEQARVEHTKRSANKMQTTMDNRELFLGDQAHDDNICGSFSGLMTAIKTWSQRFSGGKGDSFKEEEFADYQRVMPLCTVLRDLEGVTSQKKRKRLFVRGWTAYIMSQSLFRTFDIMGVIGTDVWLEKGLAEDFSYMEKALWYSERKVISYRSFNDWRAFTAELLTKAVATDSLHEKSDDRARRIVREAVSDVMDVVRPWHVTGDPEDVRADEDQLYRIFRDAAQFAQLLRRQRALWSIRFASRPRLPVKDETRTGPLMFDPSSMKDDRGDDEDMSLEAMKKCYVDIIVMPALYKRGTMNGERFESEEAAVPAIVVMGSNN
ncbi:hypothetical protein BKA63DRAFT_210163 [Paraphoma chrysanthemicola]|nr:hypothetical protein BKA63DRAFT_210163 [Paraphoma chrysanthemicola]